jgi:hypothetical protein
MTNSHKNTIGATILAGLSAVIAYIPDVAPWALQKITAEHTIVFKLAPMIGGLLSAIWASTGLRKGYQKDELPAGITKVMDKIPDSLTGIKGESKADGPSDKKI